ncbi:MAG: hypothetical protein ABI871_07000 [Chthoniobacterales bacterium]
MSLKGTDEFVCAGKHRFASRDFVFVRISVKYRLLEFSDGFAAGVFFYGPEGGGKKLNPG